MNKNREETDRLVEGLRGFSTPKLCDGTELYHSMDWRIKPWVGERICGPAVTVDVPGGEGGLVAEAILELHRGDVLVVAGKGHCDCSYWGDHRSICAAMKGAEGVVIDGAFRDVEGCEKAGFPIFAKGLTCGTAQKSGAGAINVPISCGGAIVNPGDIIVGDRNGVVVIRQSEAEAIMARAAKRRVRQEAVIKRMKETGEVIPRIPGKL